MDTRYLSPVLITGCQRSGTTLLRRLMGNHPALLEHPDEPQFILELFHRFGMWIPDVDLAIAFLLKHPYLPEGVSEQQLRKAFEHVHSVPLAEFVNHYLHLWGGDHLSSRRPVLKDPYFAFHPEVIDQIFPGATWIFIIRDPRGSIASQKARWARYSTREAAKIWIKAVQAGSNWQKRHPTTCIEIRYEQLLAEPGAELQNICEFLAIDYDAMRQTVELEAVNETRSSSWRRELNPIEIRWIEDLCRREMVRFGYDFLNPPVDRREYFRIRVSETTALAVKKLGRQIKSLLRKIGWKLGIGLLHIPDKKP